MTMFSSSSVMIVAISTMTLREGSSPVISRSIQASTEGHRTRIRAGSTTVRFRARDPTGSS